MTYKQYFRFSGLKLIHHYTYRIVIIRPYTKQYTLLKGHVIEYC